MVTSLTEALLTFLIVSVSSHTCLFFFLGKEDKQKDKRAT